jgi:hypothetical protein
MCELNILSVQSTGTSVTLNSIIVEVNVTACTSIDLKIEQIDSTGVNLIIRQNFTVASGMNLLVFRRTDRLTDFDKFTCGRDVTVTAECLSPERCIGTAVQPLQCPPVLPESNCPNIEFREITFSECAEDGTRTANVIVQVTPRSSSSVSAILQNERGDTLASGSGSGPFEIRATLTGVARSSTRLTVVSGDCPSSTYRINFPACTTTPICPSFGRITSTLSESCVFGRVVAELSASVTIPTGRTVRVIWDFGDGSASLPVTITSSRTISTSHDYRPGRFTASLRSLDSDDCTPVSIVLEIPECHCPETSFNVTSGECENNGSRRINVSGNLRDATGEIEAELLHNGRVVNRTRGRAPLAVNTEISAPVGSMQSFQIRVVQPEGCRGSSLTYTVPGCGVPPEEETGCIISRMAVTILLALGLITAMLALCMPMLSGTFLGVAAGLIAAAGLLLILWLIFCPVKPCNWGLLMSAQVTFGVGVGVLHFTACCPTMLFVGLGGLVAGLALFGLWKEICDISWCRLSKEMATSALVAGAILGYVFAIPTLRMTCEQNLIVLALDFFLGVNALYALGCRE